MMLELSPYRENGAKSKWPFYVMHSVVDSLDCRASVEYIVT